MGKLFGMTTVYEPQMSSDIESDLVFITVNGLDQVSDTLWTKTDDSNTYLINTLHSLQPSSRIRSCVYDGRHWSQKSLEGKGYIDLTAKMLSTAMAENCSEVTSRYQDFVSTKNNKGYQDPRCPTILIAYSIGGLVVKQALLESQRYGMSSWLYRYLRGVVFISSPNFEITTQWSNALHRTPQRMSKPDDDTPNEVATDYFATVCAKTSYWFRRTLPTQSYKEICTDPLTCISTNGTGRQWLSPDSQRPSGRDDLIFCHYLCESSKSRDNHTHCYSCSISDSPAQISQHSLSEGGINNFRFVRILEIALIDLSNCCTERKGLSSSTIDDFGTFSRCLQRMSLGPYHPCTCVSGSKLQVVRKFPYHSYEIRSFTRHLALCQQEDALPLGPGDDPELSSSRIINNTDYRQILGNISSEREALATRIFAWLLWANQPLTVQELKAAMYVYWDLPTSTVGPTYMESRSVENLANSITYVCGGLVTIDHKHFVRFVHHEARRLLESDVNRMSTLLKRDGAQELLALTCVRVLTWHSQFQLRQSQRSPTSGDVLSPSHALGLLNYAETNWTKHCRAAESGSFYVAGVIDEYFRISHSQISCINEEEMDLPEAIKQVQWRTTVLHECALYGFMELSKICIEMGADVNSKDCSRMTSPLFKALSNQHWDLALLFIQRGASYNPGPETEESYALHHASALGRLDIIKFLLQNGADPNAETILGETPLHWAALSDRPESVEQLIIAGSDVNKATELTKETPLHLAAMLDSGKTLPILLCSADLRARNSEGWTALHYAAAFGHLNTVELLIERGAEVYVEAYTPGTTALALATKYGHESVTRLLLSCLLDESYPIPPIPVYTVPILSYSNTNKDVSNSSGVSASHITNEDDVRIFLQSGFGSSHFLERESFIDG